MKRIIYDYKNPHIVGKAKSSIRIGRLIVGIIVVSLVIALVYVLFFRKSDYKRETKEFFVAVAGRYATEEEADRAAAALRLKGGGGFVTEDDGFCVVAAAYSCKDDALNVAERYGYEVVGTGSFTIYDDADIIEICTLPERIFTSLCSVADDYDRGMVSAAAKDLAVKDAKKSVERIREGAPYGEDKTKVGIDEMLANLSSALDASEKINLRYCLIDIAYIYKNFLIYIS